MCHIIESDIQFCIHVLQMKSYTKNNITKIFIVLQISTLKRLTVLVLLTGIQFYILEITPVIFEEWGLERGNRSNIPLLFGITDHTYSSAMMFRLFVAFMVDYKVAFLN